MASRPISTVAASRLRMTRARTATTPRRPDRAQPRRRARRQARLCRRPRPLQLCRARRTGGRFANLAAPARHSARAAHPALPARHDRLSDRVSRRDQGRRRSGRGQHAAHRRRIRVHAGRQPRPGGRRFGAAAAGHASAALAALPEPRPDADRLRRRCAGRLARPTRSPRRRAPPRPRRPIRDDPASGSIRRARPARPRAPCTRMRA